MFLPGERGLSAGCTLLGRGLRRGHAQALTAWRFPADWSVHDPGWGRWIRDHGKHRDL